MRGTVTLKHYSENITDIYKNYKRSLNLLTQILVQIQYQYLYQNYKRSLNLLTQTLVQIQYQYLYKLNFTK